MSKFISSRRAYVFVLEISSTKWNCVFVSLGKDVEILILLFASSFEANLISYAGLDRDRICGWPLLHSRRWKKEQHMNRRHKKSEKSLVSSFPLLSRITTRAPTTYNKLKSHHLRGFGNDNTAFIPREKTSRAWFAGLTGWRALVESQTLATGLSECMFPCCGSRRCVVWDQNGNVTADQGERLLI